MIANEENIKMRSEAFDKVIKNSEKEFSPESPILAEDQEAGILIWKSVQNNEVSYFLGIRDVNIRISESDLYVITRLFNESAAKLLHINEG